VNHIAQTGIIGFAREQLREKEREKDSLDIGIAKSQSNGAEINAVEKV